MSHTYTFSEPHIVMHNRAFHMTVRGYIGVPKKNETAAMLVFQTNETAAMLVFHNNEKAAILLFQKNETAAMLMFQTSPLGVKLFSYSFVAINLHRCWPRQ